MKKIVQQQLKILARLILKKYQPKIIGISGSVGKTSTKEAVAFLLTKKFTVRSTPKNYNNEFGLPLTIIGSLSPGKSLFGWLGVYFKGLSLLLITKKYPEILVLEMGIDRPGDMLYLTSIAKPDVAIITAVSHSHLEYFGSLGNIQKEKQVLVEQLQPGGLAILNYDQELVRPMAEVSPCRVLTYGLQAGADLQVVDLIFKQDAQAEFFGGINCKLNYQGSVVPMNLTKIINEAGIYSVLAAILTGLHLGFHLVDTTNAWSDFSLPAGRLNLISGIKQTNIIDDTYNSSPESSKLALKTLARLETKQGKKYAVLGDMLEIGSYSEDGHLMIGQLVAELKIDYLLTVGERARDIYRGAIENGFNRDQVWHFPYPEEAGKFLQNRLQPGDLILVKGSQGIRMEKIVKEIMADPQNAPKLLVRQETAWKT